MIKFITPGFLKNFDQYLLKNHPFWYVVKIHHILYYTLLMWLMSFCLGIILPIDVSSYDPVSSSGIWIFAFVVLGLIVLAVWLYHLTIYNIEDRFGKYNRWDDVKYLIVFMFGINLLMSFSYPMILQMKKRLGNTFDDRTLALQYNALNLANKYITNEITDFQFCGHDIDEDLSTDDVKSNDSMAFHADRPFYDLGKYKNFLAYSPNSEVNDFSFWKVEQVKPSEEFNHFLLGEKQIREEYQKHQTDAEILQALNNMLNVKNCYDKSGGFTAKEFLRYYKSYPKECSDISPNINSENSNDSRYFNLLYLSYNMAHVYNAKFKLSGLLSDKYLVFSFYFSFFLALSIIVFRNNTWQHYLVTIVTFILIWIIVGIFSVFFRFNTGGNLFSTLLLLIWLVAFVMMLLYAFKKDLYRIPGIVATNLVYFTLPVFPLIIVVYIHEVFDVWKCYSYFYDSVSSEIYRQECERLSQQYHLAIKYAQWIGVSLFLLVLMPLFKIVYARQKALPRKK